MKQLFEALGIDKKYAHTHVFRHSRAVHLLNAGLSLVELKKVLGHKNINNTLVFEGKIKKIKGKHPYIEKIDAHTVKIDLKAADGKKKKRRDKEIIIVIK